MQKKQKERIPLSVVFHNLKNANSYRLSLFGKGITHIDYVFSDIFTSLIRQLDLSHNAIVTLDNLKQFKNIQFLNVAYNKIQEPKQLLKLSSLTQLKTVIAKNNPFNGKNLGRQVYEFMVCMETDVNLHSQDIKHKYERLIDSYEKRQIWQNYLKKIKVHIQLVNQFKMDSFNFTDLKIVMKSMNQFATNFNSRFTIGRSLVIFKNKQKITFQEAIDRNFQKVNTQNQELLKEINNFQQVINNIKANAKEKRRSLERKNQKSQEKVNKQINYPQKQTSSKIPLKSIGRQFLNSSRSRQGENIKKKSIKEEATQFQQQYFNTLIKNNPIYQLLWSPINSLKPKEKDILIQSLSKDLKQKYLALFQLQRIKKDNFQIKAELNNIKQYSKQEFNNLEKELAFKTQIINNLKNQCLGKDNQIIELQVILKQKQFELKIKNDRISFDKSILNESEIKLESINKKYILFEQQQDKQQTIIQIRNKRIISETLKVLSKKAKHINLIKKYQKLQQINNNMKILSQSFMNWKILFSNAKKTTIVKKTLKDRNKLLFLKNLQFINNTKKSLLLITKIRFNSKSIEFMLNLKQFFTKERSKINKIKQSEIHYNFVLKKTYFLKLYQQKQKSDNLIKDCIADNKLKNTLLEKYFRYIKIFSKMSFLYETQLTQNLKIYQRIFYLNRFLKQSTEKLLIKDKFLYLVIYLNKQRRIINFTKLKINTSEISQQMEARINAIQKKRKFQSFDFFRSLTNFKSMKLRDCSYKHKLVQNLRKANLLKIWFAKNANFPRVKGKFKKCLTIIKNKLRSNILINLCKQLHLEQIINSLTIKKVYQKLKLFQTSKRQFKNKIQNIFTMRKKYDYQSKRKFYLQSRILLIQSKKLQNYKMKNIYHKMLMVFMNWKIVILKTKIQNLQLTVQQFEPELLNIHSQQLTNNSQRNRLKLIIQQKNLQIKLLLQEINCLKVHVEAKTIKYENLRELYSEVVQANIYNQRKFDSLIKLDSLTKFDSLTKILPQRGDKRELVIGELQSFERRF